MKRSLLLITILSLIGLPGYAQKGEWIFVPQAGMSIHNQTVDIGAIAMKYQFGLEGKLEARKSIDKFSAFVLSAGYKRSTASQVDNNGPLSKHEAALNRFPLLAGLRYDAPMGFGSVFFIQPEAGIEFTSIRYEVKTDLALMSHPAVHGTDTHIMPVLNIHAGFEYPLTSKLKASLDARVEHSFWNDVNYTYDANFRSSWLAGQDTYKTSSNGLNLGVGLRLGYAF